jgi:hypothetical protein
VTKLEPEEVCMKIRQLMLVSLLALHFYCPQLFSKQPVITIAIAIIQTWPEDDKK